MPPTDVNGKPDGASVYPEKSEDFFVRTSSPAIRALEQTIQDIADTDTPVLIAGESGTAKDAVALRIHQLSRHKCGPFVKIDCAASPMECFIGNGHRSTDSANSPSTITGGTVFLDKVEELNTVYQSKLLHGLLNDGRMLAGRVISATRSNLEQKMRAGHFREDLYYRLSVVCLNLPPLRQRQEDIPALVDFFLAKYAALFLKPKPAISTAAMRVLLDYSWPGNIRELEYIIQQMVDVGDENLALADLRASRRSPAVGPAEGLSLKQAGRAASRLAERELILRMLARTHWNRKRAAQELQISYKALLYKLKQMELDSAGTEG